MVSFVQFSKWFNRDFWRAFREGTFPIFLPTNDQEKRELLESIYKDIITSRYAPSLPENEILINKGYGISRIVPVFSIRDYCVYYFCIKELEDVLCGNRTENTFGGWTLGGRIRKKEYEEIEHDFGNDYGKFSFNPLAWSKAFGEFNSLLFSQLDGGYYEHILQFDIANFYDSIRLNILERWIREDSPSDKGFIISLLFYFLNHWNRHNTFLEHQTVGLPQDALADCSRILANYYLQRYDKFAAEACAAINSLYFRYADDQMILTNTPEKLNGVMLLLSKNLDHYGLRINQKKVNLWDNQGLQTYRCRQLHAIFAKKEFCSDPDYVKLFTDGYLALSNHELRASWNGGRPLLNRLIWTNIESLPDDLFGKVLKRLLSPQYLLSVEHAKINRIYNLSKLSKNPIDFLDHIQRLGAATVHNSYHYEALQFCKKNKLEKLQIYFEQRVQELATQVDSCNIC